MWNVAASGYENLQNFTTEATEDTEKDKRRNRIGAQITIRKDLFPKEFRCLSVFSVPSVVKLFPVVC
jgi:hypothetical protein